MVSKIDKYIAEPMSRKNIRKMAHELRTLCSYDDIYSFPIVNVLELFSNCGIFNLEICSIDEMGSKFGETIPSRNLIKLREDVYEKACEGDGFSRATCAHELFHWLRHREDTVSFCRRAEDFKKRRVYEDPEWQANCFLGELLVPKNLVKGMSVEEVMKKCGVSVSMAKYQLSKYKEEGWK